MSLIQARSIISPILQVNVRSTGGRRVDFNINLNLTSLLIPSEECKRLGYIRRIGNGEVAYRGAARRDVLPEVDDGGVEEWYRHYVKDAAAVKSFALERVVGYLDVSWIRPNWVASSLPLNTAVLWTSRFYSPTTKSLSKIPTSSTDSPLASRAAPLVGIGARLSRLSDPLPQLRMANHAANALSNARKPGDWNGEIPLRHIPETPELGYCSR